MKRLVELWARLSRYRALKQKGEAAYFGLPVYFPRNSHIFERAVETGVYEPETLELLLGLIHSNTTYIDVGANIGLLSLPVLARMGDVSVISIEAAPDTFRFLERTHRQAKALRWSVVNAAVGDRPGEVDFFSGDCAQGAFDGLRDTGRGGQKRAVKVKMRTLTEIWRDAGCPAVSVVKIDIEGAEMSAMRGALELIAKTAPALVIEWSFRNLPAYQMAPETLLDFCSEIGYAVYSFPSLVRIDDASLLGLTMRQTETFLLLPRRVG